MWLSYALSLSTIFLTVLAVYIYFISKKEAYRFFYPAFVLFVLFSIVPISYSVYVSFTNFKTGHLLERKEVVDIFTNEKIIEKNSELLSFQLYSKVNSKFLLQDNLSVAFSEGESKLTLAPATTPPEGFTKNTPNEILDFIDAHPNIKVIHPKLGEYSLYRSDLLAKISSRYQGNADTGFIDRVTGEKVTEDKKEGQFKIAGENVGPGYFTFVGLQNYKELFFDPATKFVFFKALSWTVTWALGSVTLTFFLGAFLAVMLNDLTGKSKILYRMIFIIPYSIPFFISVLIFKGMLNKDFGEINHFLSFLKISPVPWLENKLWARVSVLLVNLWLGFPYMLLVITGILQSIPKSIYEASSLEGATKFQNFRFLTFPLVLRAMIPLLMGSFAFNFNNFVGIYLLTGGGPVISNVSTPLGETDILISYTYRLAFEGSQGQNFATASAVSMMIFIIVVALTLLNFKVSKKLNKQ
jgi:ABC-type sugar transport system permease subunit